MTQTVVRPVAPLPPAGDTARDWRRLIRNVLVVSIALLVVLSTMFEIARLGYGHNLVFGLARLFCLGQEANVPTWFTSEMLSIASLLAATAALIRYQAKDSLARQWGLLSALLCLMSLDETAVMHEAFSARVAQALFGVQDVPWFCVLRVDCPRRDCPRTDHVVVLDFVAKSPAAGAPPLHTRSCDSISAVPWE